MPTIWDWSTTSGNNATADADINWSEGQFPSTVNDSARQMMGRQAEWLKDNGILSASGSANTITVNTSSQISTPPHGMTLAFRAAAANTGAVTFSINGGTGLPVRKPKPSSTSIVALEANDLTQGGVYLVHYDSAASSSVGAWILINPTTNQASIGAAIEASTEKNTPADGDFFTGVLASGSTVFKTTWGSIKTALATIFYNKTEVNNIVAGGMSGRAYPRRADGQDFNLNGSTASAQNPPAIIGGGWDGNFNNFYFYSTGSLRVAYAASSGDVGGYTAAQLRSYSEDRGYWRTQDYLVDRQAGNLATYCLAYWTGTGSMNPNSWVDGSALRVSSAWGNSATSALSGSWVCMGFCDSNTQTSRVTNFFRRA